MGDVGMDGPWGDLRTRRERIAAIVAVIVIVIGIVSYAIYAQTHRANIICDKYGCRADDPTTTVPWPTAPYVTVPPST